LSITRFKNPQIEPKSPYDMTLPQDRIHIKTNHPMTIKRLLRAAILLHGEGILDQINPETKGASALDSQGEGLLGVTLTPYVGEGVPPASLRLDGTQTWGPPGGAPRSGPNQDTSFQNPVVKGQFRLQWGLRDLNLGVLDGPVASSLGRPDGFLVVEVNGWSRAGIIKHQLALGYRLLSKTGIDLDLLFPKHIIVGFQYRAHAPKIYLGTQVDLHFRRPLPVSEELTSVQTADLPDPFSTSRQQARPLELYETNSFFLGMQQRIGIPWHLFMEAGIRRTEWQLFGPVGQTVDRKTQKFLPFALLGIKSLIPSLQQPTH
jgi:hypothetical protein